MGRARPAACLLGKDQLGTPGGQLFLQGKDQLLKEKEMMLINGPKPKENVACTVTMGNHLLKEKEMMLINGPKRKENVVCTVTMANHFNKGADISEREWMHIL